MPGRGGALAGMSTIRTVDDGLGKFGRRAAGERQAALHYQHAIAEALGLDEVVRGVRRSRRCGPRTRVRRPPHRAELTAETRRADCGRHHPIHALMCVIAVYSGGVMDARETMNVSLGRTSLVVAASDGPGG